MGLPDRMNDDPSSFEISNTKRERDNYIIRHVTVKRIIIINSQTIGRNLIRFRVESILVRQLV